LGLSETHEVFRPLWATSQAAFDSSEKTFLSRDSIGEACRYLRLSPPLTGELLEHQGCITENPALRRLAWHGYYLLFQTPARGCLEREAWPALPAALGPVAAAFYALVLLAGVPQVRALHAARGIPEAVTLDTLSDLELWLGEYRKRHGVWGLAEMAWLNCHFGGRLVKLGRLQFEMRRFQPDFLFFRHRISQQVAALAGPGQRFRRDGQFDGANGIEAPQEAWTSAYATGNGVYRGHPVTADGRALPSPVELSAEEWFPILAPGDPSLGVHIPAIGPLDPEACEASFARAAEFFPKHFPEHAFRAFDCDSWLLDHQLEQYLPDTSNIVRFLRSFYLLPASKASEAQPLDRVFDGRFAGVDTAPQDTALQRHFMSHMKRGGHWRNALGVRFAEDSSQGPDFYRTSTAETPWAAANESPR
jgi:hypothetical protein